MHEAKTTIDDTQNDDRTSEPPVNDAHRGLATGLVIMQVLVDSECRLEEDQDSHNEIADDLVVGIELADSLPKHDT